MAAGESSQHKQASARTSTLCRGTNQAGPVLRWPTIAETPLRWFGATSWSGLSVASLDTARRVEMSVALCEMLNFLISRGRATKQLFEAFTGVGPLLFRNVVGSRPRTWQRNVIGTAILEGFRSKFLLKLASNERLRPLIQFHCRLRGYIRAAFLTQFMPWAQRIIVIIRSCPNRRNSVLHHTLAEVPLLFFAFHARTN